MRLTILLLVISFTSVFSQKSWNLLGSFGLVQNQTSYPQVIKKGRIINGWDAGAQLRYYKNRFYINTGLNFSVIDIEANPKLEIFADRSAFYSLGLPVRAGYDIYHNDHFKLRGQSGLNLMYIFKVDDNDLFITKSQMTPLRFGVQFGLGVDFYPITFDYHFDLGINRSYTDLEYKTNGHLLTMGIIFW